MDAPELEKWPPLLQGVAWGVAAITGVVMWVFGRNKKSDSESGPEDSTEGLRARLDNETLRRDLSEVLSASRKSLFEAIETLTSDIRRDFAGIDKRLRGLEIDIAVLKARQNIRSRRKPDDNED